MNSSERHNLEDLAFWFSCSINALKAIHRVMEEGPDNPADYIDGVFAVRQQLDALAEQLQAMVDGGEETA